VFRSRGRQAGREPGPHSAPSCEWWAAPAASSASYRVRVTATLVVLAGGASKRMGTHKPDVPLAGRSMLEWVVASAGTHPVLVVGGPEVTIAPWIADEVRDGPAGGLALALASVDGPVVLVGADQPWLRPETVDALAGFAAEAACVPVHAERRQVTCARYPDGIAQIAARVAAEGKGLQELLGLIPRVELAEETWRSWGEDGRSWYSVDTPDDLAEGMDRYGPPG
jgi:molybdopterin-guanine dinucleotide biosynthesis protein A